MSKESQSKKSGREEAESQTVEEADLNELHFTYENDNWENAVSNAVWFGKKIPPKRNQGV